MLYKKPGNMKYTDMCIYIDENMWKLENAGEFPEIEEKIYNYLWLLVKALAIKKRMFQKFEDYDGYAFYSASRLFFAIRRNLKNRDTVVKGKLIKPIKSCLNYTKALLYPMKLEYLHEAYKQDFYFESINNKFDSREFMEKQKTEIRASAVTYEELLKTARDTFSSISPILNRILATLPFHRNSIEYKYIKISILLNCLQSLRAKNRLMIGPTVYVWKLPKSMQTYVQLKLQELFAALKEDIISTDEAYKLDDRTLNYMLSNTSGELTVNETGN